MLGRLKEVGGHRVLKRGSLDHRRDLLGRDLEVSLKGMRCTPKQCIGG